MNFNRYHMGLKLNNFDYFFNINPEKLNPAKLVESINQGPKQNSLFQFVANVDI